MNTKTCCVTGHRTIEDSKIANIKKELRKHIMQAIDDDYTHFISGFAEGIDLYFAEIIAELKGKYAITLGAAIPYRNRMKTRDMEFQKLIKHCDVINVHAEEYKAPCFINRNRFMVQSSDLVIAVYDGRKRGGTLFTINYARSSNKEVRVINI